VPLRGRPYREKTEVPEGEIKDGGVPSIYKQDAVTLRQAWLFLYREHLPGTGFPIRLPEQPSGSLVRVSTRVRALRPWSTKEEKHLMC
jgi:hypothetical protein